jgi:hypothetical protein
MNMFIRVITYFWFEDLMLSFISNVDLIFSNESQGCPFGYRCIPGSKFISNDW